MNLEQYTNASDPVQDEPRTRLAVEAMGEGIALGFRNRCTDAWEHPGRTLAQGAVAGLAGIAMGRFAHTSAVKVGLTLAGIGCAADLGRRVYSAGVSAQEARQNPATYHENTKAIAETLGSPLFDYTVMAVPAIAGLYTGAKFMSPRRIASTTTAVHRTPAETVTPPSELAAQPIKATPGPAEISIPTYTETASGRSGPDILKTSADSPLGKLYLENSPSVVHVRIGRSADGMTDGYRAGTGFFVDKRGLVATNDHVIAGNDILAIEMRDGTTIPARLVARDAVADLALIEPVGKTITSRPLELATQSVTDCGKQLTVLGHPGFEPQVVMSRGQMLGFFTMEGRPATRGPAPKEPMFTAIIGSDVPSTNGFSGSPMLENGKVVCILRGELGASEGLIGATDVQHLRLLMNELAAARPTVGHLELQSTFEASVGVFGPRTLRTSVKSTWPVDDATNYYNLKEMDFATHWWLKPKN